MRGLTLRVTNPTATRVPITDIAGVSGVSPGETIEILYTDDVQQSLEYGGLNVSITQGKLTASFVSGSTLSQAPIGSTLVGSTPTSDGVRGLVPRPVIADRGRFLKGDGTWGGLTALSIGAIPESKMTTQGDILLRGITTSERLPLGTLGQTLRSGVVRPEWRTTTISGTVALRPAPSAYYQGVSYWATDTLSLSICCYNGLAWVWTSLGAGGLVPGSTRKRIPSDEVVQVPDGFQYLVYDSLTFLGTASMVLQGDADLVILDEPPVPWREVLLPATLTTSSAVTQTIATVGTALNGASVFDMTLNAYYTDFSAQVAFKVLATVTNLAGVVTIHDVVTTTTDPGTTWGVSVVAASPNIVVEVTGDAGPPNIRWSLTGTTQVN